MMKKLKLKKNLRRSITNGHPWVFRDALVESTAESAEIVELVDDQGSVAWGWYNATSPIAVRVLSVASVNDWRSWVRQKALSAMQVRQSDASLHQTNGWRIIYGESDGMPGLIVDRYDDVLSLYYDGEEAQTFWQPFAEDVVQVIESGLTVSTVWQVVRGRKRQLVRGSREEVVIAEKNAKFNVDLRRGQKTGFFLDQRPNRLLVGTHAPGQTVLNLYSYTGGFSVHAALAGASKVTSVDISKPVIDAARGNFILNGIDPGAHGFFAEDVEVFLKKLKHQFDIVICDPPNFAPKESAKSAALSTYARINTLACRAVAPGGLLVSASCSSHIDWPQFEGAVNRGIRKTGRVARIIARSGAGSDHPRRFGFPESNYLQCLFIRLD